MVDGCFVLAAGMAGPADPPRAAGDGARFQGVLPPSWLAVVVLVGLVHVALFRLAIDAAGMARPAAAVAPAAISVRWVASVAQAGVAITPEPPVAPVATPAPAVVVPAPTLRRRTPPKPAVVARAAVAPPPAAAGPAERPALPAPSIPSADAPASDAPRLTPPRADAAYLSNPAPDYPASALAQRQEGRVVLRVLVAADGRPQEVSVARGSGFAALDQAAVAAVQRWRFVAASRDGVAVDARVLVPITFKLRT